jgi:ubiquinone/menaquinone biosynthesis C-methylase UbiE
MMYASYAGSDYLRRAAQSAPIHAIKERTYELMQIAAGSRVLDIGCGPATDTIALAQRVGASGAVMGVDHDPAMVAEANAEAVRAGTHAWTQHRQADVAALPFANGVFDACRGERVLQHLPFARAIAAVAEACRVVRSGGRVVLADTDWGTFSIDTDEVSIERRITRFHAERFFNPHAGRQLVRLLKSSGCGDVTSESHAIPVEPASVAYLLSESERYAVEAGVIAPQEWLRWRAALADAEARNLAFAHLTIVVAGGTRP